MLFAKNIEISSSLLKLTQSCPPLKLAATGWECSATTSWGL